ncbi:brain-specific serine protease 4 isoform X4 [Sciurus carolinensis]|uniref:brain-specific serine protease 4 isoform X4 n=1 Tax=Sciurus carolinensis TaxID=30640 RepID=UPI001FB50FB5|nr:brain-specific serine protease 4 isoform X4 [Sciurus carolinensis]
MAQTRHLGDWSSSIPLPGIKPGSLQGAPHTTAARPALSSPTRHLAGPRPPPAMEVPRPPPALGGGCRRVLTALLLLVSTVDGAGTGRTEAATLSATKIPVSPDCGKPQQLNRIVGGQDSADAEWPWVVSIQKNGTHHCAGSLLTNRWVVTAAHCFKGSLNTPSLFSVLLGAWQLENPGPRSQEFSERILPICLPDSSVHLPPNTDCWIAGWGSIREGEPLPHPQILQKLKVPIIHSDICSRLYWRGSGQETITEDMLCAGYLEGQRDACLGDSGGPLMCQVDGAWLLAGIISWGEGCAERNRPGVYTSLPAHRSWVERVVQGVQLRGRSPGTGARRESSAGFPGAGRS